MSQAKVTEQAIFIGYARAQIAAGVWKGHVDSIGDRERPPRVGLTGEALERWVDRMAQKYPGQVN